MIQRSDPSRPLAETCRRYPRLDAHVVWRAAGLGVPRQPAVNTSLGGMLVYSDESLELGRVLELELLGRDGVVIDLHARVVRVDALPAAAPARFDVALEFIDVPSEARARLAERLGLGPSEVPASGRRSRPSATRGPDGQRLRVLFVTPYLPSPPRFGGQTRLHGLIAGMAVSHDVSVLSLVDPDEDQTESIEATGQYARLVVTVPNRRLAPRKKRWLQLRSMVSARSYEWLLHRDDRFESVLEHLLAKEHFDVVQFEFPHMAAYRRKTIPGAPEGPVFLLDEHNIEYDVARQMAVADGAAVRRAYNAVNWKKIEREERAAWRALDGCTLTSSRDERLLLHGVPETRTAVIPNGVDLEFFQPRDGGEPRDPRLLLFFGAIDYHPNTDALLFFVNQVFPALRAGVPGTRLCIVGRRPPPAITALRGTDIEVTGAVEDLRPYLERASVVIAPLRLGGGTRLKILEAMAMGKAVVSTTLGAEGLDVVPERDLLVGDAPERFADQTRALLEDPVRAARIGQSSRRVVTSRYGWTASTSRLSAFYGEVLSARREAARGAEGVVSRTS